MQHDVSHPATETVSELARLRGELQEAKRRFAGSIAAPYGDERAGALQDCERIEERIRVLSEHAEHQAGSVERLRSELADAEREWQHAQSTLPDRIRRLEERIEQAMKTYQSLTGEPWDEWHARLQAEREFTFRQGFAPVR